MKKLDDLHKTVGLLSPDFLPVVMVEIIKLRDMVDAWFGMDLLSGYQTAIIDFKNELVWVNSYFKDNNKKSLKFGFVPCTMINHLVSLQNSARRQHTAIKKNFKEIQCQ